MNTSIQIMDVAELTFACHRYSSNLGPGGWLKITAKVSPRGGGSGAASPTNAASSDVAFHTFDAKVLDHFNDIARALEGPLVPEPAKGEAWEPLP